ncbi:bifunctional RNase H/acid phosphatase [Actinomadura scrupuli]|uniref:bifunctional RNase H/acid phosphatase n=1 Tax=Actinomadura scrupuli TaxID=559629 RepID=UPI003D98D50B
MSGKLIVEADGGSRGNPGPAGYGALVKDALTGQVLDEIAESIGHATNNVAEYRGLIAGLRAAAALAERPAVEVRMDSKLVVEQMSGRWKIKHPDMIPLALEAREAAKDLGAVRYTWIPRAQNAHADRLANEAMDAAVQGRPWSRRARDPQPGSRSRPAAGPDEEPEPAPRPAATWAGATTTPTTTLLLRHGQTPLSDEKRFAGTGDIPLTETGLLQAKAAARALGDRGIDVIVSSPLRRCRDTAAEVAAATGTEIRIEDGFRETDFGDWEGHTFAEVRERWPAEMDAWLADPAVAPPGGESFADTARRVRTGLDKLMVRYRHQTVLVVSHVTPIKMLVRHALQAPPQALYRMHLDVSSLSVIDWYDDGPAVLRGLNDTHHLQP